MSNETMEFDGKCALAVSMGGPGKAPAAKAKYTIERNGKTYGFFGAVPLMIAKAMPSIIDKAEKKWAQAQA